MKLILVSHGKTKENIKGILQGTRPGKLTNAGKKDSKRLALLLKHEKIDVIFSSDLGRAIFITKEIARLHPAINVYYTKELEERSMGILQGQNKLRLKQKQGLASIKFRPKCGESLIDVRKRIKKFTNKIYITHKNKTVLFSTHRGVIGCLLSAFLHLPLKETNKIKLKNSAMIILEIRYLFSSGIDSTSAPF